MVKLERPEPWPNLPPGSKPPAHGIPVKDRKPGVVSVARNVSKSNYELGAMTKYIVPIPDNKFDEAWKYFCDMYDMTISFDKFKDAITDTHLRLEILEDGYTDTCQRELIVDTIARKYVSKAWPMNGDTSEYKKDFFEKAKAAGVMEFNTFF